MNIIDYFKFESSEELVLPDFQRKFVWELSKQKSLLACLVVEVPLGSVLILKGGNDQFCFRKLCYTDSKKTEEIKEVLYLLDGQQRLSCLKSMLANLYKEYGRYLQLD